MRAKRKSTIFYVGWNDRGVCEQPFFSRNAAIQHGVWRDYDGKGIFLVEVPAVITKLAIKSSRYDFSGTDKGLSPG